MPQVHPYAGRVDVNFDPSQARQDEIQCTQFGKCVDPHMKCDDKLSRRYRRFADQLCSDKDLRDWFNRVMDDYTRRM